MPDLTTAALTDDDCTDLFACLMERCGGCRFCGEWDWIDDLYLSVDTIGGE